LVAYAILSGKPLILNQIDLITKKIKVDGFWMYQSKYLPKHHNAIKESAKLVQSGELVIPIAAIYPLSAIKEAVAHTLKGEKVLLDFKG
jgi:NADPH:quinone reductase-like Zn-dependent oxidoreductase